MLSEGKITLPKNLVNLELEVVKPDEDTEENPEEDFNIQLKDNLNFLNIKDAQIIETVKNEFETVVSESEVHVDFVVDIDDSQLIEDQTSLLKRIYRLIQYWLSTVAQLHDCEGMRSHTQISKKITLLNFILLIINLIMLKYFHIEREKTFNNFHF